MVEQECELTGVTLLPLKKIHYLSAAHGFVLPYIFNRFMGAPSERSPSDECLCSQIIYHFSTDVYVTNIR